MKDARKQIVDAARALYIAMVFLLPGMQLWGQFCPPQSCSTPEYPLVVSVNVMPPYGPKILDYWKTPGKVRVRICNNTQNSYSIYLAGFISSDNGVGASTSGTPWNTPINIAPGFPVEFDLLSLQSYFGETPYTLTGINNIEDIRSGNLPEGNYQLCFRAYNNNFPNEPLSCDLDGCSIPFSLVYPSSPQLLSPVCGGTESPVQESTLLFNWIPPSGAGVTAPVLYNFRLIELTAGISLTQALGATPALSQMYIGFQQSGLPMPSFQYSPALACPPLEDGKTYAWCVQAYDPTGQTIFQNSGFSEPCTFTYTKNDPLTLYSGGAGFMPVYPMSGDTVPWTDFPVIHRFFPYKEEYKHYKGNFKIYNNGVELGRYNASNRWPAGPKNSQAEALGMTTLTAEQAQHLPLFLPQGQSTADGSRTMVFEKGKTYTWDADVSLYTNVNGTGNPDAQSNIGGSFTVGMGRPLPVIPAQRDTLPPGNVKMAFKTSQKPNQIQPSDEIRHAVIIGNVKYYYGLIDERWILEVSRKEDFSEIVYTESKRIAEEPGFGTISICNPAYNEAYLESELYKEITCETSFTDTGMYYWRVGWLKETELVSGVKYNQSEIRMFYVGEDADSVSQDSVIAYSGTPVPTPGDCLSGCIAPPIPENKKLASDTARVGTFVMVGLFEMEITEISYTADKKATGKGLIRNTLFKAPLRVKFSGIKINSEMQVFSGDVISEYDNEGIVPPQFRTGASAASGMIDVPQEAIIGTIDMIETQNRIVSAFTGNTPVAMPIGLDRDVDGGRMVVGVVAMTFRPEGASLNAMAKFPIPDLNSALGLGARDVCFSPQGINAGKGKLYLPGDVNIPMGDGNILTFKGTQYTAGNYSVESGQGTFGAWDCQGFKELNVDGAVKFSKDLLVQDTESGEPGNDTVQASFRFALYRGWDFLVRLSFNTPFQVKGAKGLGFVVDEAWMDMSILDDPDYMEFPEAYPRPAMGRWKGFWLRELSVKLPKQFKTVGNSNRRISAGIKNMFIDENGFTGKVGLFNLMKIQEGDLDGWAFSLDEFSVEFLASDFKSGGFKGNVRLPLDTASNLVYEATISQNIPTGDLAFNFVIAPKNNIDFKAWMAKIDVSSDSYIKVTANNAGFTAQANLTGKITIEGSTPMGQMSLPLLSVQNLKVQTQEPYFAVENVTAFGLASPQKYMGMSFTESSLGNQELVEGSGFPVGIKNVGMDIRDKFVGVKFTLSVDIMGGGNNDSENNGFSGETVLFVGTQPGKTNGRIHLSAPKVDLDKVSIAADLGPLTFAGKLAFFKDHTTYGNGMLGELQAEFQPGVEVKVAGQFGSVRGFRYWYVDASAVFGAEGISVFPSFNINGFGGGAWYKMNRSSASYSIPAIDSQTPDSTVGASRSGVTYIPDAGVVFGLNAMLAFGSPGGGKTYNGDLTLAAQFNQNGGFELGLDGQVFMMASRSDRANAPVKGNALIRFTHNPDSGNVMSANFRVDVKMGDFLTGNGEVSILYSNPNWHIYVGTPAHHTQGTGAPVTLKLDFLDLAKADVSAYLMAGSNIPLATAENLPKSLTDILGSIDASQTGSGFSWRNEQNADYSSGFAFGVQFDVRQSIDFRIFYASLFFGAGFDISVIQSNMLCNDGEGGTYFRGANGWYTTGQMYAYIGGEVGVKVDLWLVKGTFKIFSANAAAYLQCGFPNPSYFKGRVGANYNILNGLIKGNCRFNFEVGEKCSPVEVNPLLAINPISDINPADGSRNISCSIIPVVTFNMEVNKEFSLELENEEGEFENRTFKFTLTEYTIKTAGGSVLPSNKFITPDNLSAELLPASYLGRAGSLGGEEYIIYVKIKGWEKNEAGGFIPSTYKDEANQIRQVEKDTLVKFYVGAYPKTILPQNVKETYPINKQRFYLQEQQKRAFVKLHQAVDLFRARPASMPGSIDRYEYVARIVPVAGGQVHEAPIAPANGAISEVRFEMPALSNSTIYRVQLVRKSIPKAGSGAASNTLQKEFSTNVWSDGSSLEVQSNKRGARQFANTDLVLYTLYFRTSRYNTFAQKMEALSVSGLSTFNELSTFKYLFLSLAPAEGFDSYDVIPVSYTIGSQSGKNPPLYSLVHLTESQNTWFASFAEPKIYDVYSAIKSMANPTLPAPDKSMAEKVSWYNTLTAILGGLTDAECSSGVTQVVPKQVELPRLKINIHRQVYDDFYRLKAIAEEIKQRRGDPNLSSSSYTSSQRAAMRLILSSEYIPMSTGIYNLNFKYRFPEVTASVTQVNSGAGAPLVNAQFTQAGLAVVEGKNISYNYVANSSANASGTIPASPLVLPPLVPIISMPKPKK